MAIAVLRLTDFDECNSRSARTWDQGAAAFFAKVHHKPLPQFETRTHHSGFSGRYADAQLLVDIGLSILRQPRDRFACYEDAIRQEYGWVPDAAFRDGRSAVLRKFLARECLYFTPKFRHRYEESARANLQWSLDRLARLTD